MKKRLRISGNRYFRLLMIILVLSMIVLLMNTQVNKNKILRQNEDLIEQAVIESANSINVLFSYAEDSIILASTLASEKIENQEFQPLLLKSMVDKTPFNYIRYIDEKGSGITSDGTFFDASQRDYYLEGMQGKSGITNVLESVVNNKSMMIFYTPVYRNDGTVIGVMSGAIENKTLLNMLKSNAFDVEMRSYLCKSDGTIAAATDTNLPGENILYEIKNSGIVSENSYKKIEDAFHNGKSLAYVYEGNSGDSRGYISSLEKEGWIILKAIPSDLIRQMTVDANQMAVFSSILIIAVFGLYVFSILYFYSREQKKYSDENSILKDSIQRNSRQKEIYEKVLQNAIVAFAEIFTLELNKGIFCKVYPLTEESKGEFFIQDNILKYKNTVDVEDIQEVIDLDDIKDILTIEDYAEIKHKRRKENGDTSWYLISFIVMERKNDLPSVLTVTIRDINDILEQEEREKELLTLAIRKAEEASTAKMNFLANISHDMRTPMNAIIGMTNIAAAYMDDKEKVRDCLEKIDYSGKQLLTLINEVLDMSKIESGKLKLKEEEIDLLDFLSDVIVLLRPQIQDKKHEFNLQIKKIKHSKVIADKFRMQQCFMNVLSNSVKYTPVGGKIDITACEMPSGQENTGCYKFVFEDNGIGMSETFLKRIFEPFEREEDIRISNIQGTGLGMAITKNIIEMLHGDVKVESEINKGTRFTITLNLKYSDNLDTAKNKEKDPDLNSEIRCVQQEDFSGVRILLAEDNEINREIAVEILSMTGADVVAVGNGKEAVEAFEKSSEYYYDILLLDIQMPVMNGYDAAKEIRGLAREDAKKVVIMAMTANALPEDIIASKNAGMDEHLTKPLDLNKMVQILRKWI